MNALKFQQAILTECLTCVQNGKPLLRRADWVEKDEDTVALFLTAHVAMFIPRHLLALDLEKINKVQSADRIIKDALKLQADDNLLAPTDEYRLMDHRKIHVYKARAWMTGIDQGLLKYFDPTFYRLYQAKEHGTILITEKCAGYEAPVGIVLPHHIK